MRPPRPHMHALVARASTGHPCVLRVAPNSTRSASYQYAASAGMRHTSIFRKPSHRLQFTYTGIFRTREKTIRETEGHSLWQRLACIVQHANRTTQFQIGDRSVTAIWVACGPRCCAPTNHAIFAGPGLFPNLLSLTLIVTPPPHP